jgi:hypothetical protein
MNRLDANKRAQVIAALVEGSRIRSVSRMTGVTRNTILSLLVDVGMACAEYQDKALRNLSCKRIQADEIWSFCYAKDRNLPTEKQGKFGFGSIWTWTAIDADSKLICSWTVGNRDAGSAYEFMQDLASRLRNRVQLTTDGHNAYLVAVDEAFGNNIDYAMLIKIYGESQEPEKRYSPAVCVDCQTKVITGEPSPKHISTSYVELRITPAMAAGVTDHAWEISDIVGMLEQWEKRQDEERNERTYNRFGSALGQG